MSAPNLIDDALAALATQAAAFEALLLMASALHKGVKWRHFEDVVRRFAAVRPALAPSVLGIVVALEVAAAASLCVPGLRVMGAVVAALVWMAYLGLILRAILQGRGDADCGCTWGPTQRPLGAYQVTRNGVLLGLAVFIALATPGTSAGAVQGSQVLAACALLALYGALDQVMALQPLRGGEVA